MKFENPFNKPKETTDKQQKINRLRIEVNHIVDKLGLGIDDGIKETIVMLKAMNFITSSSCEGHTEKGRYSFPYVEFYTAAPDGWKDSAEKKEEWRKANLAQRARLEPLLEAFYKNRAIASDIKLQLHNMGIFGAFRMRSHGVSLSEDELNIKTEQDAVKKINMYKTEMNNFTQFLEKEFSKS